MEESTTASEASAQTAADAGDIVGMLEALAAEGLLDNLYEIIAAKFSGRLDFDDACWVVGRAVDALAARISDGKAVRSILPYLVKTAENMAKDLASEMARMVPLDREPVDENFPALSDADRDRLEQEAADLRRRQLGEVRRLINLLPQARQRQVMSLVFDTIEEQGEPITNGEIASTLGITPNNAAVIKSRAFSRLVEIGKEQGEVHPDFTLRRDGSSSGKLPEATTGGNGKEES